MNKRFPRYPDDADYQTNSPSYYEDLARKQKLIKMLAKKMWEYDKELAKKFEEWEKNLEEFDDEVLKLLLESLENDTLKNIINNHYINTPYIKINDFEKKDNERDDTGRIQRAIDSIDNGIIFFDGEYYISDIIR